MLFIISPEAEVYTVRPQRFNLSYFSDSMLQSYGEMQEKARK